MSKQPNEKPDQAYQDFTSQVGFHLFGAIPEWPEEFFWPLIDSLEWSKTCKNYHRLALEKRIVEQCKLEQAVAAAVAAFEHRGVFEFMMDDVVPDRWELLPSEDGMDDFCYHVVGLGQEFFESTFRDQTEIRRMMKEGDYEESLKYVFEMAYMHYPIEEYRRVADLLGGVIPLEQLGDAGHGTFTEWESELAMVVRNDEKSFYLVTPTGYYHAPKS